MSQKYKDSPSCRSGEMSSGVDRNVSEVQRKNHLVDQMRSVVVLIGMPQKYKDSPSCRSGEISSWVERNISEEQRQFIL